MIILEVKIDFNHYLYRNQYVHELHLSQGILIQKIHEMDRMTFQDVNGSRTIRLDFMLL